MFRSSLNLDCFAIPSHLFVLYSLLSVTDTVFERQLGPHAHNHSPDEESSALAELLQGSLSTEGMLSPMALMFLNPARRR